MSCKIKDLCERIGSGGTPSRKNKSYYNLGNIKWLKTKELDDIKIYDTEEKITEEGLKKSSAKLYPKDTIVMAMYGATVGKLGIIKEEMCTNQACCNMVVDSNKCNYKFLYYSLLYNRESIINLANGAAQQNLSVGVIGDYEINLPSLEEQEKIADILSSLDDKVELNNEMNKTLEEMAQSIFKRWFVDFEFPNEDGKPYKSSGGEMVDSELGMIPKGWEVKALGDICDVKGGKRLPKGKAVLDEKTEYPYLRVTDITSGYVNMNSIKYIDEETREKISRYIIEYSDLYISIAGTIGLVGSINKELDGASLTENMARIICNNIEKYYMRLYLNYGEIQHLIKTRAVGSTQPKLPLYVIKDIPVLVPTDKVMNRFKEIIIPVYKSIEENLSNIETIVEIRDSLLPKLMSGEIKV